jgi:hypothetical protein
MGRHLTAELTYGCFDPVHILNIYFNIILLLLLDLQGLCSY